MTIETKYEIGDEVFAMPYRSIGRFPIKAIRIKREIERKFCIKPYEWTTIEYLVDDEWLNEDKLFPTKEELLKSL